MLVSIIRVEPAKVDHRDGLRFLSNHEKISLRGLLDSRNGQAHTAREIANG